MAKHKLLLADDSITIQKVVNLTFADEGIEVISVGDGNSAMAKFEEFLPDLVMADINMPGLSGYEICERIKQNESTRQIPVILLVGSFEPFDEAEAQRVGANDYLTKPFQSIRQLVTKVSDLLNSTAGDGENPSETAAPPNSFDDTLKMAKPDSEFDELGDAGMDDEMIQANQVGNFAYDETRRFESQPETETENYGKTQPLSAEELDEINSRHTQEPTDLSRQPIYGFTGESDNRGQDYSDEETDSEEAETQEFTVDENEFSSETDESQPTPMPEAASVLELDEMNLLELPPRESFSPNVPPPLVFEDNYVSSVGTTQEIESEPAETNEIKANESEINEVETNQVETEVETNEAETVDDETSQVESNVEETSTADAAQFSNLSPEIIDAIAAKVVEKISDQVIREIAWEVVPQMTDLIVKRLAEEKLKE